MKQTAIINDYHSSMHKNKKKLGTDVIFMISSFVCTNLQVSMNGFKHGKFNEAPH